MHRTDISSILIIGSGPIVIGQAAEFDYSGTQACRALRGLGYRTVLVNSNPASIMTDPEVADRTYIEPLTPETVTRIAETEKVDALLPTVGGQTALNIAREMYSNGTLERMGLVMLGANPRTIELAEDRREFAVLAEELGLPMPRAMVVHDVEAAHKAVESYGFPIIIRPSYTLGGSGGGIAYNEQEFVQLVTQGIELSPVNEVQLDQSVIGWKEFELEVIRDMADNCMVVCTIENFDAMGVHTGDSITVAPAQTLTDREFQRMRDYAFRVLRGVGLETGGANVQFAVNPEDGEILLIEMNPRVSRSSALASKATGFPIAKIAALLAVGIRLDELENDATGGRLPASFEPSLDYVITKIPRFDFDKFPGETSHLTTSMRSVGESMAVGKTFCESLQKACASLEQGWNGLDTLMKGDEDPQGLHTRICTELAEPTPQRLLHIADAFRHGMELDEIQRLSYVDPWFLHQIQDIIQAEKRLDGSRIEEHGHEDLLRLKRLGFTDSRLATLLDCSEDQVRSRRHELGLRPVFHRIDSCAGEFASATKYMYSTYWSSQCEVGQIDQPATVVIGSGPNRIGQAIEFDYSCVHALQGIQELGHDAVMINCNPETVSTDFDFSNRLYFEPITLEHTLEILEREQPTGVLLGFGGQTPLKLSHDFERLGVTVLGTPSAAIELAEDREKFGSLMKRLELTQPANVSASTAEDALELGKGLNYPTMARPSFVLGGRAIEILWSYEDLQAYIQRVQIEQRSWPLLLDEFLQNAIEIDVDALCDGERVLVSSPMEHVEQAGIHSGDSSCVVPSYSLSRKVIRSAIEIVRTLALNIGVRGLINVQLAVVNETIYIIEVNPRASRTLPFIAKSIGLPMAKFAAQIALGSRLDDLVGDLDEIHPPTGIHAVKAAKLPFDKFAAADPILGPEMRATGEVMGFGTTAGEAIAKAHLAVGFKNPATVDPAQKRALISVRDEDKKYTLRLAKKLANAGFKLSATSGTAEYLKKEGGLEVEEIKKYKEGRPNAIDGLTNKQYSLVVNTAAGRKAIQDSQYMRRQALTNGVFTSTTIEAAEMLVDSLKNFDALEPRCLQDVHGRE